MFKRNLPGGIIFLFDMGIVFFSLIAAYLVRFSLAIPEKEIATFYFVFPVVLGVRAASFYIARTYAGIIRYTSTRDVQRIVGTIFTGTLIMSVLNILAFSVKEFYLVPFSIIIIEFLVTIFLMTSLRMMVKIMYVESMNPSREKTNVIIFGAGESGLITKRTLDRDAGTKYKVLAFVDDDEKKSGKKAEGVTIYHAGREFEKLLAENEVQH